MMTTSLAISCAKGDHHQRWAAAQLLLLLVHSLAHQGSTAIDPPAATMKYNGGKFKVLQFADMHLQNGANTSCANVAPAAEADCSDLNTTEFLDTVLKLEKPDLVVFSGDNTHAANSVTWAIDLFTQVCKQNGVPFAAVQGNHDQASLQKGMSRKKVQEYYNQVPGSKSVSGPELPENNVKTTVEPGADWPWGDDGHYGNFYIELEKADGSVGATLYLLDSGDNAKYPTVGGADWVFDSQVAWFLNTSLELQAQRGGKVLPASAWFHIPLPEHYDLLHAGTAFSPPKATISGVNQEGVSCASVHSGLFSAFVETGDVKTVSVGHDHVNDFCGNYFGVELCYAGGAGFHAYGKTGWARRARIFEYYENGTISTHKRLDPWLGQSAVIDQEQLWPKSGGVYEAGLRRRRAPDPTTLQYHPLNKFDDDDDDE